MANRTIQAKALACEAHFRTASYDPKDQTIEIVVTTGERVPRQGYDGFFWEELAIDESSVRLERLNSGRCNLIDNHGAVDSAWGDTRWQTKNALGVIVKNSARFEQIDGRSVLVCKARLSGRADLEGKRQDIRDGILTQATAGYRVYRYQVTERDASGVEVRRAVDWEPCEVSLTIFPAESDAYVRSRGDTSNPCEVLDLADRSNGTTTMLPENTPTNAPAPVASAPVEGTRSAPAPTPAPAPAPSPAPAPVEGARAGGPAPRPESDVRADERARCDGIRALCQRFSIEARVGDDLISRNISLDQARVAIAEEWSKQGAPAPAATGLQIVETQRSGEDLAMQEALIFRGYPALLPAEKLSAQARSFAGYSMSDFARKILERNGKAHMGLSRNDLVTRALGTSDFPELLANTAGKALRDQYAQAKRTWSPWTRKGNLSDFKTVSRVQIGGAPVLDEVPEDGSITPGKVSEQAEKYRLKTYAKSLPITRQALINDDLDAFTRIPALFAASSANKIEDLVWAILGDNAAMSDAVALFHTTHKNNATGGGSALAEAGLSAARLLLQKQVGLQSEILNLTATYLIVPAALLTTAEKLVATIQAVTVGGVNPFMGKLTIISNARLDAQTNGATTWYLTCAPNECDTIEVGFLDGNEGPRIEQEVGTRVDGIEISCKLDCGAKALDFRGMVRNVGV